MLRATTRLLQATVSLLAAALLLVLTATAALACPICGPPDKIAVSGPGLPGIIEVTDRQTLQTFSVDTFFGVGARQATAAPAHVDAGYDLTRYYRTDPDLTASYWTLGFDHLRFYPGAAGGRGLIFYEGPTSGDTQHYARFLDLDVRAGKWYQATAAEDAAMRQLLAAAGSAPSSATPPGRTTAPVRDQAAGGWPFAAWWLLVGVGAATALGAGLLLLRVRQRAREPDARHISTTTP